MTVNEYPYTVSKPEFITKIPDISLGKRYLLYFFSAEETILKTVSTLEEAEKELDLLCRKYDKLNVPYKGGTFEQVSSSERNL